MGLHITVGGWYSHLISHRCTYWKYFFCKYHCIICTWVKINIKLVHADLIFESSFIHRSTLISRVMSSACLALLASVHRLGAALMAWHTTYHFLSWAPGGGDTEPIPWPHHGHLTLPILCWYGVTNFTQLVNLPWKDIWRIWGKLVFSTTLL